jgi:hypothetical protein
MTENRQAPQGQQKQIHPAAVACDLMMRADLKGREVEAFAQTYNWLQAILEGELVIIQKEMHENYQRDVDRLREMQESKKYEPAVPPNDAEETAEIPVLEPEGEQGAVDLDAVE